MLIPGPYDARQRRGIISNRVLNRTRSASAAAARFVADRLRAYSTRGIVQAGINAGKRVFSPSPAQAGALSSIGWTAAAAATRSASAPPAKKRKAMVSNKPGPTFNPGGAGGYVKKGGKKRKSKKRKPKLSKMMREAISKLIGKKSRHWNAISNTDDYNVHCLRTSTDYPIVTLPAPLGVPSALANDCVGWAELTLTNGTYITALLNDAYRKDAYAASGTAVVRNIPLTGTLGGGDQMEFKISFSDKFFMKNGTNQGARVDIFFVKARDQVTFTPLQELQQRYQDAYVDSAAVILGTNPQVITSNFKQLWHTPGMKKSANNVWQLERHDTVVLNPGDEASFKYASRMQVKGPLSAALYPKGSTCLVMRIIGTLTHSDSSPSLIHRGKAQIDCELTGVTDVKVRDALFTGQERVVANQSVTAFTDDVTAGDANQYIVAI